MLNGSRPLVGLIANPASGKDIRRLVAHGSAIDNQTKVSIIRRVLVGGQALGGIRVLWMPDEQHLCERAVEGLPAETRARSDATPIEMPVTGEAEDSAVAARLMSEKGAACLVVLGGDGTARVVARGAGDVPLLPISTGTNNVLPRHTEGTIAGISAGAVALGLVPRREAIYRHKRLRVQVAGRSAMDALVDVAVLEGRFLGSRAVWDMSRLRQVIVSRSSPASIGISAIAGAVRPLSVSEPLGVALWLASPDDEARCRFRALAAVGPGLVARLGVERVRELRSGESVAIEADRPLVLALDGEREISLAPGQTATVTLGLDGPWIVEPDRVMEGLASGGLLCSPCDGA